MAKDSQPDNKKSRMEKCNYQTPIISEEGKNKINNKNNNKNK